MNRQTVFITGVANYWGKKVAHRLATEPTLKLVGLDTHPRQPEIPSLTYIQDDIRQRTLVTYLQTHQVHTICHLNFCHTPTHTESAFDLNVMGTINLFGAAARAGVQKVVAMSSTMVYGARPDNPAFLRETHPLHGHRQDASVRYWVEMEQFYQKFQQTNPHISLAVLRFANIVGTQADTPLSRFLRQPTAPILLGFDPMMQLIHEEDVTEALAEAILQQDVAGLFNLAALPAMPLTQLLALAQKFPLAIPHPLATLIAHPPIEWDYLRYRWVADISKLQTEWGFTPKMPADETLRQFAQTTHPPAALLWEEIQPQIRYLRQTLEKYRKYKT